ncbi:hypothetical protein Desal_2149 [Maridesulfovibrio salexigens DSM 2638]|uniref:Uncharacterized protein n=2 Tax=Maridesulfovibrio salexigens TaxID=880 RepID=C6BW05_MARSD|nr:hypothetical protein Desal_2149 [Maridesulfovibrio salexigens DSM 2638]
MTGQELQEMSEELAVLKMSVDTLSKRFQTVLLKAKEEGQALEGESKGQPKDTKPQTMHKEATQLKTRIKGFVDAFKELGLGERKSLELALNYCGANCSLNGLGDY